MTQLLCFSVTLEADKLIAVILINLFYRLHRETFKNRNLVFAEV